MSHSKPLSRRKVICGECEEEFDRYANLEQHFERRHPNKPCREKSQTSILSLFQAKRKKTDEHDAEEQGTSSKMLSSLEFSPSHHDNESNRDSVSLDYQSTVCHSLPSASSQSVSSEIDLISRIK